jgi:hypothetical protein
VGPMAPLSSETEVGEKLHRPMITDSELPGGAAGTDMLVMPGHTAWCPRMSRRCTEACTLACMVATQARLTGVNPTPTKAGQGKERGGFAG